MTHKIEKELSEAVKLSRKEGEADESFFKRLQAKVDALPEDDWETLSEEAQLWSNTASKAVETGDPIPDFDGKLPDADAEDEGEAESEKETGVAKTKAKKTAGAGKKKAAAPAKKAAAAEKTPAKKAAAPAEKANGVAKRGRRGEFNDESKITKVAGENPFREGSKASECFKKYKVGTTVKKLLDAGVPRSKLARHAKKGVVTIA